MTVRAHELAEAGDIDDRVEDARPEEDDDAPHRHGIVDAGQMGHHDQAGEGAELLDEVDVGAVGAPHPMRKFDVAADPILLRASAGRRSARCR